MDKPKLPGDGGGGGGGRQGRACQAMATHGPSPPSVSSGRVRSWSAFFLFWG